MTTRIISIKDIDVKNGEYKDGRIVISSRKTIIQFCWSLIPYHVITFSNPLQMAGSFEHVSEFLGSIKSKLKTKLRGFSPQANRLSDCHLSAKLVPTFVDRGCRMVSARNPMAINLCFLDP
jgi:hypothetical protein